MSSQLNVSVLVAARDEYTNQLKKYLVPLIQEGFVSIYEDSIEEDESNPLRQFQIFLKEIPRWNQTILDQETKRIKDKCPFLMDCVTAIFVSHVKILASVRLGGSHSNIRIKIPTPEIFIHSVYIAAAEPFYYEPEPFSELLDRKNLEMIRDIIETSIDDTISGMIPIQNILQEYLSNTFTEHIKPPPPPEPEPETPGNILSGSEILDEPTEFDMNNNDNFSTSGESIKSDLSDLFNISDNDDNNNDLFSNEVKEINLGDTSKNNNDPIFPIGDETPFTDRLKSDDDDITKLDTNDELFNSDSNDDPFKDLSDNTNDIDNTTKESSSSGFDPLGFLGLGGSSTTDDSNKDNSKKDDDILDTDFNFFDDSNIDF